MSPICKLEITQNIPKAPNNYEIDYIILCIFIHKILVERFLQSSNHLIFHMIY
jgi:hypothetical protein